MKKVLCYAAFVWTIPFLFVLLHKKFKCTKTRNDTMEIR